MSRLAMTIIDVGWGDSILLDATGNDGRRHFGLVDCNDSTNDRSSFIFVKRYLERAGINFNDRDYTFDFILLTHAHDDHGRGIQSMFSYFETEWFWYPKSVSDHPGFGQLIRYANRYKQKVKQHEAVSRDSILPSLGEATLNILWPPYNEIDQRNENNNSIVLAITLGEVSFVLTGDLEARCWPRILPHLPDTTRLIQAPHHGAHNGLFHGNQTPWLDYLGTTAVVAMSSHIVPFGHPHPDVVDLLNQRGVTHYRTDWHYHVSFETDGTDNNLVVKWSRT